MKNDISVKLSTRLLSFAIRTIKLVQSLEKSPTGYHIGKQLLRSATSAGANYEEACAAESRNDFIHKMRIVLKELRESSYWLQLLSLTIKPGDTEVKYLLEESKELANIIGRSIVTARRNAAK